MRIYTIIFLISLPFSLLFAQDDDSRHEIKFGKIEDEAVAMTTYAPDPDAAAVVLYESGISRLGASGGDMKVTFDFVRRIKILKESALDQADWQISYDGERDILGRIQGYTYNMGEDGKVERVSLNNSDIYEEALEGEYRVRKFSMPQVKVGSVIEIKYRMTYGDYTLLRDWCFQKEIPVVYSEYTTMIPNWFRYITMTRGAFGSVKTERENYSENATFTYGQQSQQQERANILMEGNATTYWLADVPAFKSEPYTTTPEDFLCCAKFQLASINIPGESYNEVLGTWPIVARQLLDSEYFGSPFGRKPRVEDWVDPASWQQANTPERKIATLFRTVQQTLTWDGDYGFTTDLSYKDLSTTKTGNSATLNLLLWKLLEDAGIEAHPVLISTRKNGRMQNVYPLIDQFNHVVVFAKAGENWIPMDASHPLVSPGMLPTNALNHMGFMIIPDNAQWINISPYFKDSRMFMLEFDLSDEGLLKGNAAILSKDYDAIATQAAFLRKEGDESTFIQHHFFGDMSQAAISDPSVEPDTTQAHQIKVKCRMETNEYVQVAADFLYLQPLLSQTMDENPFKLEERAYPVDFACPLERKVIALYHLPDGYEPETLPAPIRLALPNKGGMFIYTINHLGHDLQVVSELRIDQPTFLPEQYPAIKQFFQLVVDKHSEQIVLKKTS